MRGKYIDWLFSRTPFPFLHVTWHNQPEECRVQIILQLPCLLFHHFFIKTKEFFSCLKLDKGKYLRLIDNFSLWQFEKVNRTFTKMISCFIAFYTIGGGGIRGFAVMIIFEIGFFSFCAKKNFGFLVLVLFAVCEFSFFKHLVFGTFPVWVPVSLRFERQLGTTTDFQWPRNLCRRHLSPTPASKRLQLW